MANVQLKRQTVYFQKRVSQEAHVPGMFSLVHDSVAEVKKC
jgi:hypothetical protein